MLSYVLPVVLAFAVVLLITPAVKKVAFKIGAVDKPNGRKVHRKLMPRMGGLGIFLGFALTVLLTQPLTPQVQGLLLGGTVIVLIGIIDDIKELSPKLKLLGQIAAALVLVLFGVRVDFITNPFSTMIVLGAMSIPVTVFWVIGVTNAVNLIDGLDGLAAGVAAIAAVTMGVIAFTEGYTDIIYLALILAAATLGFLKYNFHPASIFMGDTGAMFLGYTLSALAIMGLAKGATLISLFIPIVILGIPIFDTFFAIVRRFYNHRPIFEADKDHLHHRLLDLGYSHRQTVLLIYGLNIFLGCSAILLTRVTTDQSVIILVGLTVVMLFAAERFGVIGKRRAAVLKRSATLKNAPSHHSRGV